jgi:uncharacterized protein with PIN domain
MADYVLDSYAVLALLEDEPGAAELASMIENPRNRFWMSVANLGEVYYVVARRDGESAAVRTISDIQNQENVTIVDGTWDHVLRAAKFKVRGGLSYADSFACGLAAELGAILLSGDPELKSVHHLGLTHISG